MFTALLFYQSIIALSSLNQLIDFINSYLQWQTNIFIHTVEQQPFSAKSNPSINVHLHKGQKLYNKYFTMSAKVLCWHAGITLSAVCKWQVCFLSGLAVCDAQSAHAELLKAPCKAFSVRAHHKSLLEPQKPLWQHQNGFSGSFCAPVNFVEMAAFRPCVVPDRSVNSCSRK